MPWSSKTWVRVAKAVLKAVALLFILFAVSMCVGPYDLPISHGAITGLYALLNPDIPQAADPNTVSLEINGASAIFHKGTPAYDQLATILHRARAAHPEDSKADLDDLSKGSICGRVGIWSLGIPIHFTLYRSPTRPNLYWIHAPSLDGMKLFPLADDGSLKKLLDSNKK